ncbi:hypothetical protein L9F63_004070 [Diploptera punctata]|uniref:DNA repair and recombination protein RAD54-like n=1 Tax=Diploptera punctata TaxID=6984 RepID=A0AAD8E885_DIPPU|nr:hypothetical protein L9F63_004070 [Diploptera punctata]
MRRSTAPSSRQHSKFISPKYQDNSLPDSTIATVNKGPPAHFPNAVRSTRNILDILSAGDTESSTKTPPESIYNNESIADLTASKCTRPVTNQIFVQPTENENYDNKQTVSSGKNVKRVFNVVWGKQSKKKHKTWEGDGTLEVGLKTVILKKYRRKVLGQSSNSKTNLLEEGSRLFVGSKEVEIIDVLSTDVNVNEIRENSTSNKRFSESNEQTSEQVLKKPRKVLTKSAVQSTMKPCSRGKPFQLDYKPLVMPLPTHEHQWQYNQSHLQVMEVSVDACLARVLRSHQREGVVFMYECIMGMKRMDYHGAILADEMGLGKTLQCITLIWMLLKQGPYGGKPVLQHILVVTPSSLVANWQNEIHRWLGRERIRTFVVDQKNKPKDYKSLSRTPVMLISYEMFVRYYEDISQTKFDLLICDEGHRLKNTSIRTSINVQGCCRRILLTGTPIQNDLQEFYALVNFVNPGILGSVTEFKKYYEEPILASRQPSADDDTCELGEQRARELNHCSSWFILRRTQEVIDKYLPTKQEIVVFCISTPLQQRMYEAAVDYWESRGSEFGPEGVAHLAVITALKKICNHPSLLKSRQSDYQPAEEDILQHLCEMFSRSDCESLNQSGKLNVVMCFLEKLSKTKEKVILVSYFTQTLDLLAYLCQQKGYKYCRLDGSTPSGQRMEIVKRFNNSYSDCFVFLLSARAGGVGLNLTGASRLVLYDSDWNPATDLQAMSRIWRDGQSRSVFIYRLLTVGSIEEKIFQRQISKTDLSGAVVDPQNTNSVRLSNDELKDLFTIHRETACLTHEMLNCHCNGSGVIPVHEEKRNVSDDESSQRDCQLQISLSLKSNSCIRMNQLLQWQHFAHPFNIAVLMDMGVGYSNKVHNLYIQKFYTTMIMKSSFILK